MGQAVQFLLDFIAELLEQQENKTLHVLIIVKSFINHYAVHGY